MVYEMSTQDSRWIPWTCFTIATLLQWFVYERGWLCHYYVVVLALFGLLELGIALWLLRVSRSWLARVSVVVVFLASQWWLIQRIVGFAAWQNGGFAP
jgi:hypothetical protein